MSAVAVDTTGSRSKTTRSWRRWGGLAFGLVVICAVVAYAAHWWSVGRFIETTDDAYVGGDVSALAPRVPGLITRVAVTDNQPVKAGDLLVQIDDRNYRARLAKAEAAVAAARATLLNLDATARQQQAVITEARAGIAATDAETMRSRQDAIRFRALAASSVASIQTSEKADAAFKQAVAEGDRARARLDAASSALAVIATQKLQAQAALEGALAERDATRIDLEDTSLRAPFDGIVGNRSAHAGAFAAAGAELVSVVPARGLWVDANFKESQLAQMRPGMAATVVADVMPGAVFHGHVGSLAPATGSQFSVLPAENATGNFTKIVQRVPVRIVLDGDAGRLGPLRPGFSVTASVDERSDRP